MIDTQRHLVVVGGSAGAITVLQRMVADLPAEFSADVLIVVHLSPTHASTLASILAKDSRIPPQFRAAWAGTGGRTGFSGAAQPSPAGA